MKKKNKEKEKALVDDKKNNDEEFKIMAMNTEIEKWSNFIRSNYGDEIKIFDYCKDLNHTYKHREGKWHIYSFWQNDNDKSLKIGVAGPNSKARFMTHHYNPNSSGSNLAKSILKSGLCSKNPGEWITNNTYRINVVFDNITKLIAYALEAHLHFVYNPIYEK